MAKDNILLITTDQQRFDTLNAWGNQSIFTPHLNYMAAMGISHKISMPAARSAFRPVQPS